MIHKYLSSIYSTAMVHIAVLRTTYYAQLLPHLRNLALLVILTTWLTACNSNGNTSPNPASLSNGDAEAGQAVFTGNGCMACHALTGDAPPGIGPSLAGVAGRSRETIQSPAYTGAADTVEAYLWESITDPSIHVVEGFSPTMPAIYEQSLEEQEITNLIAYLLTLN